jgi:hypothetical protein
VGNLKFLVLNGEAEALPWSGTVGNAGPFCALGKLVSWHLQNGRLPLSGKTEFPLFHRAVGALPWEDLVVALGLCALWGEKPPGTSKMAKCEAWGLLAGVAMGSWH